MMISDFSIFFLFMIFLEFYCVIDEIRKNNYLVARMTVLLKLFQKYLTLILYFHYSFWEYKSYKFIIYGSTIYLFLVFVHGTILCIRSLYTLSHFAIPEKNLKI